MMHRNVCTSTFLASPYVHIPCRQPIFSSAIVLAAKNPELTFRLQSVKLPPPQRMGEQEMRKTQKAICLLFLVLLCGATQMSSQETSTPAQDEAIRKLQARM